MLAVEDVRSGYGRLEILQGVSLAVQPGQLTGIIGPNGAGKSTLLKTIFGYLRPFSGSIVFAGGHLEGARPDAILRRGIAFVAQSGGLFADMTVHDNLLLGAYTIANKRHLRQALQRIYDQFPIFRDRRAQLAGSLSGGEQRMLLILRALLVAPRLLLLDEPSAALAPHRIAEVYELLLRLNREGLTMLIVEQNVAAILGVADRVFVLEMGTNAFDGVPAALRASERIRNLYLGSEAV